MNKTERKWPHTAGQELRSAEGPVSMRSLTLGEAAPFDSRLSRWKPGLLPSLSSLSRGPEEPVLWVVEPPSPSEHLQSRARVTPLQAPSVVCGTSSYGAEGPQAEASRSQQTLVLYKLSWSSSRCVDAQGEAWKCMSLADKMTIFSLKTCSLKKQSIE